jgi:predicted kinase
LSPQLILITGSTGAGKTSYARALAGRTNAIRFSIDEWMTTLFWMDSPQPIEFEWTMERINRCEAMIFAMAKQVAGRGLVSLLDLGFTTKAHRDKFRDLGASAGLSVAVHFVDVDADERWRRVQHRNAEKGETFAMQVDRAMFDFMETRWEAPDAAELQANGGTRIGPDGH